MFIFNFKINGNKLMKAFVFIIAIASIIIAMMSIYKILNYNNSNKISENINSIHNSFSDNNASNQNSADNSTVSSNNIDSENFVDFLKKSHENIDDYIGKDFCITGFVYRMPDLNENEFIIARTMIIDSGSTDATAVIAGIMAKCDKIKSFENNAWVKCTGKIIKGNYATKGEIPILEITSIERANEPENLFVYMN